MIIQLIMIQIASYKYWQKICYNSNDDRYDRNIAAVIVVRVRSYTKTTYHNQLSTGQMTLTYLCITLTWCNNYPAQYIKSYSDIYFKISPTIHWTSLHYTHIHNPKHHHHHRTSPRTPTYITTHTSTHIQPYSSGKTFTMNGSLTQPGIIPQSIFYSFECIQEQFKEREFLFRVCYIEVYNEQVKG